LVTKYHHIAYYFHGKKTNFGYIAKLSIVVVYYNTNAMIKIQ